MRRKEDFYRTTATVGSMLIFILLIYFIIAISLGQYRIVVSTSHCGCESLGSIPSTDMSFCDLFFDLQGGV